MESESVLYAQQLLTAVFIILLVGALGSKIAHKLNLPDVAVFILLGILFGSSGLGLIQIKSDATLNQLVLLFGASFILFHGGTITSLHVLKKVWKTITLLSTLGVVITALVVALSATYIFHIPFLIALLLGAILASTDPAALVPIFQKFPIRQKVAQTVITESAFTDATGAILTTVVFGLIISATEINGLQVGWEFIRLAFGGILIGGIFGIVCAFLISTKGGLKDFAPMVIVITVLGTYLVSEWYHASGFMGVFVAGLMVGNAYLFKMEILQEDMHKTHHFIDAISLKVRILIFILLGSQVDLHLLTQYGLQGILIAFIFMFVARPLTVLFSLLPDRSAKWNTREILFFFWTRETGVIAAALVGIVTSANIPYGELLSATTFVIILGTIVLQASTTPWLAKKLGLLEK